MFKRLAPFFLVFLLIQTVLRITLLARGIWEAPFTTWEVVGALAHGLWFDIAVAGCALAPIALYHVALPVRAHGGVWDRRIDGILRGLFVFVLLYDAVAEHLFWTEFTTRFNFIAVDYLIYTQEVIGNIVESYPIGWMIAAVTLSAILIAWISKRLQPLSVPPGAPLRYRAALLAIVLSITVGLQFATHMEQSQFSDNAMANEAAANGMFNLFSAFLHNEINYAQFYATEPSPDVAARAHALVAEPNEHFVSDAPDSWVRIVEPQGQELRKNVVIVVMESLSADYMGSFGNTQNLTPNLDQLASEGLFFTDLYATGTRTVRGLEAVTLSIPPTPGQSIVRRPDNEGLFSIGYIFQDRGYDTRFIYGGYGYFDNMNAFFAGNGFSVIDRTQFPKEEVQFANVWGVCDEDLFSQVIKQADQSFAEQKPFFHVVMTTSNHRPYTFPEGKIDLPSKSGRLGGVKYADYSVGQLIAQAKTKPWFNDTVFVFVADHTAGAGGKVELDPKKYHIPLIMYAPGFIQPQRYEKTASQIDTAPVLLGLLQFHYRTKFYGEDLLADVDEIPHAFVSNYQKVGLVREGRLTVLEPKRRVAQMEWPSGEADKDREQRLIDDAIAYYQSASWWKERYRRIPTVLSVPFAERRAEQQAAPHSPSSVD